MRLRLKSPDMTSPVFRFLDYLIKLGMYAHDVTWNINVTRQTLGAQRLVLIVYQTTS